MSGEAPKTAKIAPFVALMEQRWSCINNSIRNP